MQSNKVFSPQEDNGRDDNTLLEASDVDAMDVEQQGYGEEGEEEVEDEEEEDPYEWTRSGGCCGITTAMKVYMGRRGWGWHWYKMRIIISVFGMMLFWVGAWNLWQYDCAMSVNLGVKTAECTPKSEYVLIGNRSVILDPDIADVAFRSEVTSIVGLLLLIASDTLLSNAGLEGALFPRWHTNWVKTTWKGKLSVMGIRTFLAMCGTTALWSGTYALMQNTALGRDWTFCGDPHEDFASGSKTNASKQCAPDFVVHVLVFAVGLLVLAITGTYSSIVFLYPEGDQAKPFILQRLLGLENVEDPAQMTLLDRLKYSIRAVASIYAQNLLWFSSTRALDYTKPYVGDRLERPFFYTVLGMFLMLLTDSLEANVWIEADEEEEEEEEVGEEEGDDEEGLKEEVEEVEEVDNASAQKDGDQSLQQFTKPSPDKMVRHFSAPIYAHETPKQHQRMPSSNPLARSPLSISVNQIYEDADGTLHEMEPGSSKSLTNIQNESTGTEEKRSRSHTITGTGVVIKTVDIENLESNENAPCCHYDQTENFRWHFRCAWALLGQLTFWYGAWTVVDTFAFGTATIGLKEGAVLQFRSTELNMFMILFGSLLLTVSGNFMTNMSIGLMPTYFPPKKTV